MGIRHAHIECSECLMYYLTTPFLEVKMYLHLRG